VSNVTHSVVACFVLRSKLARFVLKADKFLQYQYLHCGKLVQVV